MRLWSLHPSLLDSKGLTALWREGLLAQKVLKGLTRGYRHHPQLDRFRQSGEPLKAIRRYLLEVYGESCKRGYCFDVSKIKGSRTQRKIPVTRGQLEYEFRRLLKKTAVRSPDHCRTIRSLNRITPHPFFKVRPGDVEAWERL